MGYKSRGNWLVNWCMRKSQGCVGKCDICLKESQSTIVNNTGRNNKLQGKCMRPDGCYNCLFAVREGFEDNYCVLRVNRDDGNDGGKCDEWQKDDFWREKRYDRE